MLKLLRSIDRLRFEMPLALLLGAAAAFALLAMPHDLFARLPGGGLPFAQPGAALVAALVLIPAAWLAMRRPAPRGHEAEVEATDEELIEAAPIERSVRMRRADRHPDFPPREPIRASRDLGQPFMAVGTVEPEAVEPETHEAIVEPFVWAPAEDTIVPGVEPEVADAAPAFEPAPEIEPEPEPEIVASVAAFVPVEAPAAAPARNRPSLDVMMDRLTAGLERRGEGTLPIGLRAGLHRVRDAQPDLRHALDELNRLAARRG